MLASCLGRKVLPRSAGFKLLTTFGGRLKSRGDSEMHLKQFSIGRFA